MVRAALSIVRENSPLVGVSLEHGEGVGEMRRKIQAAIQEVDRGRGVLLLSDMFGGTPSNLCLSFRSEGEIEVVTGGNLPMLIKLASWKDHPPLTEAASFIGNYGQKNIARAGV